MVNKGQTHTLKSKKYVVVHEICYVFEIPCFVASTNHTREKKNLQ